MTFLNATVLICIENCPQCYNNLQVSFNFLLSDYTFVFLCKVANFIFFLGAIVLNDNFTCNLWHHSHKIPSIKCFPNEPGTLSPPRLDLIKPIPTHVPSILLSDTCLTLISCSFGAKDDLNTTFNWKLFSNFNKFESVLSTIHCDVTQMQLVVLSYINTLNKWLEQRSHLGSVRFQSCRWQYLGVITFVQKIDVVLWLFILQLYH